jgi:hypothetical protein
LNSVGAKFAAALEFINRFAVLIGIIACLAAISSQSFWIDEAHSAVKDISREWHDFIWRMQNPLGSDLQMPLYMAMLWGWEKVFGHSEFALRAMNIPLFVIALMLAVRCWHT